LSRRLSCFFLMSRMPAAGSTLSLHDALPICLLRGFIGTDVGAPTPVPAEIFTSEDFRKATEDVILRQVATGKGVILGRGAVIVRSEEHTSELQSQSNLVCRLLLEKKKHSAAHYSSSIFALGHRSVYVASIFARVDLSPWHSHARRTRPLQVRAVSWSIRHAILPQT